MLLHADQALLPEGWARDVRVRVEGGRIAEVLPGAAPQGERVACLLPAPANLHSHTFQRAMAGMTEARSAGQDSFWTWRALMYRFLDRLTPEDVQAIAAQVMVEMAEAGFASVAEFHYLHHAPDGTPYADRAEMAGRIAAAAAETGLGLTLLPVIYERGGCDGRALGPGQRRFGNDPDGFAALMAAAEGLLKVLPGDTVLGVAPHSLRAVSPGTLARVPGMTAGPLHMHLAEQQAEVDEVLAATGMRPVEWALENLPLDGRWCLIHCTQMTEAETARLAASGAVAGLCPITEANLGDGIFPATGWRAAGGAWGVGSDSNVLISLAEELRVLEYSQRLRDRARAVLAEPGLSVGRVLWQEAAQGGAQAAGRGAGAIAVGAWADLLAPDMEATMLYGRQGDEVLDAFAFCGTAGLVNRLWSAGRPLVRDGRHVSRDGVTRRFRNTLAALKARA